MKLIVGLGNPEPKYSETRHNAGFLFVDELQRETQNSKVKSQNYNSKVKIFKSNKFMNESGEFVKSLLSKYPGIPVSDIYIVHDDLDIILGEYKIQFGKGPRDHNGVKSVDEALGTDQYWHIRIGIENRIENGDLGIKGKDYVLEDFSEEERKILDRVIMEVCHKIKEL